MYVKDGIRRIFRGLPSGFGPNVQKKQNAPSWPGGVATFLFFHYVVETGLLLTTVVLVAVDLTRHYVLMVDLLLFLRRQLASVGGAVVAVRFLESF